MKKISDAYRQKLLRNIVDNLQVSVNIFDTDGNRVFVNPYYYFVTGKKPGSTLSESFNPAFESKRKDTVLDQKVREALREGKISEIYNYLYRSRLKKTHYYFDMQIGPLKDKQGEIIGAYSIAKDATARYLIKRKLRRLNRNLEKIVAEKTMHLQRANLQLKKHSEDKDLLLSHVAHEIKTILTIIKGNVDLIKRNDESQNPLSLECHKEIDEEVERLSKAISDLVFIARADSYADLFRMESFDLTKVIRDAIKKHKPIAKDKDFRLIFSPPKPGKLAIKADKLKIQTVVSNLIENALKYGRDGGNLKISAFAKKNETLVSFADDGIGIAPENIDSIFEPFFQVKKTGDKKIAKGFGLGLSICKKIIEAHKGTIEVKSELGKGTEFTVALPREKAGT